MKRPEFTVQRLRADGEPLEAPRALVWPDAYQALALEWPAGVPLVELKHHFGLARAAPGHPVDACAIVHDAIRFSARITYTGSNDDGSKTKAPPREAQQAHRPLCEAVA